MLDDLIDLAIRITFLGCLICASIALFAIAYEAITKGFI